MADKSKAKAMNKSQITAALAEETGLSKVQVSEVLNAMDGLVKKQLGKRGPGMFALPGMFKMTTRRVPATKAHKGIDPFTKQERMFAAKPARTKVVIRPLKALKDAV